MNHEKNRNITLIIVSDCGNSLYTDCFIVSAYLRQNKICASNNRLILEHTIDNENVAKFVEYLNRKGIRLGLEDLIAFFEFVVSPQEKEVNGAVYTPEYIREMTREERLS